MYTTSSNHHHRDDDYSRPRPRPRPLALPRPTDDTLSLAAVAADVLAQWPVKLPTRPSRVCILPGPSVSVCVFVLSRGQREVGDREFFVPSVGTTRCFRLPLSSRWRGFGRRSRSIGPHAHCSRLLSSQWIASRSRARSAYPALSFSHAPPSLLADIADSRTTDSQHTPADQ